MDIYWTLAVCQVLGKHWGNSEEQDSLLSQSFILAFLYSAFHLAAILKVYSSFSTAPKEFIIQGDIIVDRYDKGFWIWT